MRSIHLSVMFPIVTIVVMVTSELCATIVATDCDVVIIDRSRSVFVNKGWFTPWLTY